MNSIAIVDDHQIVSEAIAGLINAVPQYKVLFELRNGKELTQKLEQKKNIPDLILLDINMPIMDGFETAAWLQTNHPTIPFVALTMNDDDESIIKMLKLGAKGYLLKDIDSDELIIAINEVLKKGFYYTEMVTSKLVQNLTADHSISQKMSTLKEKEVEFLKLACTEMTYREIADAMYVSPKTVEGYRDEVFHKLNVKSRIGLVMLAIKYGWVSL